MAATGRAGPAEPAGGTPKGRPGGRVGRRSPAVSAVPASGGAEPVRGPGGGGLRGTVGQVVVVGEGGGFGGPDAAGEVDGLTCGVVGEGVADQDGGGGGEAEGGGFGVGWAAGVGGCAGAGGGAAGVRC